MTDYFNLYNNPEQARQHFAGLDKNLRSCCAEMAASHEFSLSNTAIRKLFNDRYLDPFGYEDGRPEVLARVVADEVLDEENGIAQKVADGIEADFPIEPGTRRLQLSLLTPAMVEADAFLVEGRELTDEVFDSLYKPFYYEFETLIRPSDASSNDAYGALLSKLQDEGLSGKWFCAELSATEPVGIPTVEGVLTFIGSLPTMQKVYLKWENAVRLKPSSLPSPFAIFQTVESDSKISSNYSQILCDDQCGYKAYVLNVGQANCCYLIGKGRNRCLGGVFVDLGIPRATEWPRAPHGLHAVSYNMKKIVGWKPRAVLLSHWHEDHVKAAFTLDPAKTFNRKDMVWVAPVEEVRSQSIRRLIYYLENNCNTCWIGHSFDGHAELSQSGSSLIGKGRGMQGAITLQDNPNANGLIYRICSTVFAGDCLYKYWPNALYGTAGSIANLVAPHHGAHTTSCDKTALQHVGFSQNGNGGLAPYAYLSYGIGNSYNHPRQSHIDLLDTHGFVQPIRATPNCPNTHRYEFPA